MEENEIVKELTKRERREAKRAEKLLTKEENLQKSKNKKMGSWILWVLLLVVLVGGFVWLVATSPTIPESDFVSREPFHWHPKLTIYVRGEQQFLPGEIGIGAIHQPIHTHAKDIGQGLIHLEFGGAARKEDVMLGQFFKNWGKDIRSFGTNMTMKVNGEPNLEFENYVMQDGDKIELNYE